MKRLTGLFVVIAVLLLSGASAFAGLAPILYGVATPVIEKMKQDETLSIGMIPETMFYSINPETGAAFEIGPIGFSQCSSLDFEPETNKLFAVCRRLEDIVEEKTNGPAGVVVLVNIDMSTGQGTEIGSLNMIGDKTGRVTDISFRSDGTLFAHVARVQGGSELEADTLTRLSPVNTNYLGVINTQTGQLTLLGQTGLGDEFSAIGFSREDNLYHSTDDGEMGMLHMLHQTTGNATLLRTLIYPAQFSGRNIITSMDMETPRGDLLGVLYSEDSAKEELEAADTRGEVVEGFFLIAINPASGGIEVIGETQDQIAAIAFLNRERMLQVPTLSEYGLIITFVMFLGAAIVFLRRRQIKSGI